MLAPLALAASLLPALPEDPPPSSRETWEGVDRIVAIGDVHGGYVRFVRILRETGLVDRENRWIGGDTHLVQTGDVVDRGPHARKVLDLIRRLETEALEAGGRVHFLIGNHETLRLFGDLTYTHPNEFAEFRTRDAAKVRAELYRKHVEALAEEGSPPPRPPDRERWFDEHSLESFQFLDAMSPSGEYGKWIRGHNAVIRINDTIFVHGGISPKYAEMSLARINRTIRRELAESRRKGSMADDQLGPLWYRGLAKGSERRLEEPLRRFLEKNGARRIAIAHTRSRGGMAVRHGGRVILIDVEARRPRGPAACLLIEDGAFYERRGRRGRRLPVVPPEKDKNE